MVDPERWRRSRRHRCHRLAGLRVLVTGSAQLYARGCRLRRRIRLIRAALVELLGKIDTFDRERGCLLHLCKDCIERLKTRSIKISAERDVQRERNGQAKPEPTALFAACQKRAVLKIIELGNSHNCVPTNRQRTENVKPCRSPFALRSAARGSQLYC